MDHKASLQEVEQHDPEFCGCFRESQREPPAVRANSLLMKTMATDEMEEGEQTGEG